MLKHNRTYVGFFGIEPRLPSFGFFVAFPILLQQDSFAGTTLQAPNNSLMPLLHYSRNV